jgi:hypothetical protein
MAKLTAGQMLARMRWDSPDADVQREDMKAHAQWMTQVRIAKHKGEPLPPRPPRSNAKGKKKPRSTSLAFVVAHSTSRPTCMALKKLDEQPTSQMKPSVVGTDKELKGMENDIRTRRALANSPEEPEAESDSFRYREAERWKS